MYACVCMCVCVCVCVVGGGKSVLCEYNVHGDVWNICVHEYVCVD